ncbi:MAG: Uncharacterized protein G01um101493_425 [Microgenomates group bacterium Gr01-1014_93]|nr:MAG: Uncharacterized protein G01um101493_425 [Microgenomates group bacterium Gr01-1014_93]
MEDSRKKAINLYAKKPWERFLSNFKFWEEPYEVVERILPEKGVVIDLGCGEGLLANYLALASLERKIIGFEIDPGRLERARKGIKNTTFKVGDIVNLSYPKGDVYLLFHVLHHLPSEEAQEKVLKKIKEKLSSGGKLIIVEVYVETSIKYLAAWIADHFLVPWVFEKRFFTRVYFRGERQWKDLLKSLGYNVKLKLEIKGRPFPNVIFECFPKEYD